MKGIVIHHQNGISRAIEGKTRRGRLSMRLIQAVAGAQEKSSSKPTYVFYEDDRVIARSSRVLVLHGRRYPAVEHWFVLSEGVLLAAPAAEQQVSNSV